MNGGNEVKRDQLPDFFQTNVAAGPVDIRVAIPKLRRTRRELKNFSRRPAGSHRQYLKAWSAF